MKLTSLAAAVGAASLIAFPVQPAFANPEVRAVVLKDQGGCVAFVPTGNGDEFWFAFSFPPFTPPAEFMQVENSGGNSLFKCHMKSGEYLIGFFGPPFPVEFKNRAYGNAFCIGATEGESSHGNVRTTKDGDVFVTCAVTGEVDPLEFIAAP